MSSVSFHEEDGVHVVQMTRPTMTSDQITKATRQELESFIVNNFKSQLDNAQSQQELAQSFDVLFTKLRPQHRIIANPAALGFAAYALPLFLFSCYNTELINKFTMFVTLSDAFWYGGVVQFAAGMWQFVLGDAYAATFFSSYGAFWVSYVLLENTVFSLTGSYLWIVKDGAATDISRLYDVQQAVGLWLLAWLFFSIILLITSIRKTKCYFIILITLALAVISLISAWFGPSDRCLQAGGWFGLMSSFAAWYACAAHLINEAWGRNVLPGITPCSPCNKKE